MGMTTLRMAVALVGGFMSVGIAMSAEGKAFYGIAFDPESDKPRVQHILPDGPAEKGGMNVGDVLLKCDGESVKELAELRKAIRAKKPGDKVAFEVQRADSVMTIRVTVGEYVPKGA